jgi:isochorismate synthase
VTTPIGSTSIAARTEPHLSGESALYPGLEPWDCLTRARAETAGQPVLFWESPDGESVAGIGSACLLEASGPERFAELRSRLERVLGRAEHRGAEPQGFPGALAIGGFSFAEQGVRPGWPGFKDGSFRVPERIFSRAPGSETIETRWTKHSGEESEPDDAIHDPAATEEEWDRPAWIRAVRLTLEKIQAGEISKAVLARSREIRLHSSANAASILTSLREAYPTCYRFMIDDGRGNAFLGASPERLVRLAGGDVSTEAVAGTQRCEPGDDAAALALALVARAKDRSEQEVVVRHLLETLGPVCDGLEAPEHPEVMRLPHLLHLRTRVRGRARRDAHVLDLIARLHPTPAVAGWPKAGALEWIRGVERLDRGWYSGAIGWVNAAGEGDFAVGIRSVAIRGGNARVFAGAGIVEGSDPELEWNETELKMRGILDAIARD